MDFGELCFSSWSLWSLFPILRTNLVVGRAAQGNLLVSKENECLVYWACSTTSSIIAVFADTDSFGRGRVVFRDGLKLKKK